MKKCPKCRRTFSNSTTRCPYCSTSRVPALLSDEFDVVDEVAGLVVLGSLLDSTGHAELHDSFGGGDTGGGGSSRDYDGGSSDSGGGGED